MNPDKPTIRQAFLVDVSWVRKEGGDHGILCITGGGEVAAFRRQNQVHQLK
jgi:hypothetical protein